MRKTLLITLDYYPRLGGVARYYHNICLNLPKENILVYTEPRKDKKEDEVDHKIIRKRIVHHNWPFLKWLPSMIDIIKTVKKERIELILVGEVLPLGYVAYLIKLIYNIPYFVFLHGTDVLRAKSTNHKEYFTRYIFKEAEKIVCNSVYTKGLANQIEKIEDKSYVLYPGLNIQEMNRLTTNTTEIREKYSLENKKILLSVSRLVKRKGVDKVIKILPQLKEKHEIAYAVIGDGEEKENLRKLSKELGVQDNIIFLNNLSDAEMYSWYQLADIFVMAPRTLKDFDIEGFGIVYLEASYFKAPIITSVTGGEKEAVTPGKTGLTRKRQILDR